MRGLLVLAVCVGLALGGCGGGSVGSTSTATSTSAEVTTTPQPSNQSTTAQAPEKSKQDEGKSSGSSAQQGDKSSSSSSSAKHLHLVRVPMISSAPKAGSRHPAPGVKTVKGGDNSVQEYGVEADESSRREASIALATYLNARVKGNWAGACALLAQRPTEQLEKLSGNKADCAEVLAATGKETPSMPGSSISEVLSFRGVGDISGDPSYLIFTGPPGQTLFSMPMYSEGGAWKVGLAQPSELPV
jgi:hypothetical protein